jgi:pilus assembly protein CpaE
VSANTKVLVVSDEQNLSEDIQYRIAGAFPQNLQLHPREVRREIVRLEPDIVVLLEPHDDTGPQLLHYISNELPNTIVVYLTENRDPILARDVNRSGAFDILFMPDEITAINDVLNRAVKALQVQKKAKSEAAAGFTWGRGQVITFYSGKGGVGKSLVAGSLAQTIQLDSNSSVLLVDLNLQYGGIETYLNVEHDRSIFDLTPVLKELNDNHIRNVTAIEPHSQVEVLVSPMDAEIAENITEDHVQRLLRVARLYYDYILVDLPTEMSPLVFTALEEADRMFYVLTPDAPAMRTLGQVLDLFNKLSIDPQGRLEIILNRLSKDTELNAKDVKQHFDYPVIAELREDAKKVQQLINRGHPIRKNKRDGKSINFARDLQKLARWLLTQQSRSAS